MGIFRRIGRAVKPLVNVPRWMDARGIMRNAEYIGGTVKNLFVPRQGTRQESFSEALKRLNLTEQLIQQRYREFQRLFGIFLGITTLLIIYAVYLIFVAHWRAVLLTVVVAGIASAQLFRYHFWMFQIRRRKLGCSVREWFWVGIMGKKI